MSNQKDNTNNRKLMDLLNKVPGNLPMDDFEQEALEGFAMLENKEEILNLKENLDARIYSEVFTEEKKSKHGFWYAAAGLVLVIGFSIYFFQKNSPVQGNGLAIQSEPSKTGTEIQKDIEAISEKNGHQQFKQKDKANDASGGQKEEVTSMGSSAKGNAAVGEDVNTAQTSDAEAKDLPAAPEPAMEAAPEQKSVYAKVRPVSPPAVSKPQAAAVSMDKQENNEQEDTAPHTKDSNRDRMAKETDNKKIRDDVVALLEVQVVKTPARAKVEKESISSGASSTSGPANIPCYYQGGETELTKDLKNLLETKKLVQKFDATLSINVKGKTEKVVLTKSFDLDKSQQKELIKVLKGLDKFIVSGVSGDTLAAYKVIFRP